MIGSSEAGVQVMSQEGIIVRRATVKDSGTVASLLLRLLSELYDPEQYGYRADTLGPAASALLKDGRGYWALLANTQSGEAVGVITLNECAAVYAFGNFGEIPEMYVVPEYRSAGVGAELVRAAVEFGRERGWSLLEVGAPETPRWQRTVDFYMRSGFELVGPRMTLFLSTHDIR
jgi:GNAT superfamily N-acetyltransferase